MKTVTLKQTGITIGGIAYVTCWDGQEGSIGMNQKFIPLGEITKENILGCVNDGRFGVQSIDRVEIEIFDTYENGYKEFNRIIETENPDYQQFYFRGIKSLKEAV